FGLARIGPREPEANVKQLFHRARSVSGADALFLVDGTVAQRVDVTCFSEHSLACGPAKTRLMQQCRDIVLIGKLQIGIGLERPLHRDLDGLPGKERRRRRRHRRLTLRLHRRLVHGCKFGGEESEVGHRPGYLPASISSMSFLSSVLTSELSDTPRAEARRVR